MPQRNFNPIMAFLCEIVFHFMTFSFTQATFPVPSSDRTQPLHCLSSPHLMQQTCRNQWCHQSFEITDEDLALLEKVSPVFNGKRELIPPPALCPECRWQTRMSFRNEWNLYHRKCDKTGKQIISMFAPDSPLLVYDQEVWWSDAYDPLAFGREYDFSRPFFEQFDSLHRAVPKVAIQNAKSENSLYTNYSASNKNCYMVVGGLGDEDCLFGYRVFYSSNCIDCYDLFQCQHCYECTESQKLYHCVGCQQCQNSSDLFHCMDCSGCQDCYGCAGLRNKRFHIFNTPLSEEEYRTKIPTLPLIPSPSVRADIRTVHLSVPRRFAQIIQSEHVTGDQLLECRDCRDCYTLKHSQDCRFVINADHDKDCRDANFMDDCELQYYSANLQDNYHTIFSSLLWYTKECAYTMNSFNSQHLFGCSGMKKHAYCILNKQYTQEEYETLVPKIIERMRQTEEWGQHFPASISPFGYNETTANDTLLLTKEDATAREWNWRESTENQTQYLGPEYSIPRSITDVPDDITKQILTCEVTGKPYKIIPQELAFYRNMSIPIPRKCPDQRRKERMALRNPQKLWNRECAKCQKPIATSYCPERPEFVYCESCYLSSVY